MVEVRRGVVPGAGGRRRAALVARDDLPIRPVRSARPVVAGIGVRRLPSTMAAPALPLRDDSQFLPRPGHRSDSVAFGISLRADSFGIAASAPAKGFAWVEEEGRRDDLLACRAGDRQVGHAILTEPRRTERGQPYLFSGVRLSSGVAGLSAGEIR